MPMTIKVPRRTLLVLCGIASCGKSTFAARRFIPTAIVSSDFCRMLVCDDVNNQQVNRDTFDLFHYIIHKRMFNGRFTVADSTALQPDCLLIFNVPATICLERDRKRERRVGDPVIIYHAGLLQKALLDVPNEGWDQVHILGEADIMDAVIEIGS